MKKWMKFASLALALSLAFAASGCKKNEPVPEVQPPATTEDKVAENAKITDDMVTLVQAETPADAKRVTIETSMGDIVVVLYPDYAPKAVQNFLTLAEEGYYTGLKFHRVVSNYMVQSGDPTGTGTGGESSFTDESGNKVAFEPEYSLNLWNFKGALGMSPGSDGLNKSQFYIISNNKVEEETLTKMIDAKFPQKVIDHYKEVGGAPWLDGNCTVFGQVIEGLDILELIDAVEVDTNRLPVEEVIVTQVFVESD